MSGHGVRWLARMRAPRCRPSPRPSRGAVDVPGKRRRAGSQTIPPAVLGCIHSKLAKPGGAIHQHAILRPDRQQNSVYQEGRSGLQVADRYPISLFQSPRARRPHATLVPTCGLTGGSALIVRIRRDEQCRSAMPIDAKCNALDIDRLKPPRAGRDEKRHRQPSVECEPEPRQHSKEYVARTNSRGTASAHLRPNSFSRSPSFSST